MITLAVRFCQNAHPVSPHSAGKSNQSRFFQPPLFALWAFHCMKSTPTGKYLSTRRTIKNRKKMKVYLCLPLSPPLKPLNSRKTPGERAWKGTIKKNRVSDSYTSIGKGHKDLKLHEWKRSHKQHCHYFLSTHKHSKNVSMLDNTFPHIILCVFSNTFYSSDNNVLFV